MAKEESQGQSWCLALGLRGEATKKTPEAQTVWKGLKDAQSHF